MDVAVTLPRELWARGLDSRGRPRWCALERSVLGLVHGWLTTYY